MTDLELKEAKEKMKAYTDFFGGSLRDKGRIDNAKSIFDLEAILNDHHEYITDMATDAQASLERFKRAIGVY